MGERITQAFRTLLTLSTLANQAGILATTVIDASRLNGVQIEKMWSALSILGRTAGEGPILWGYARNVDSATQLQEWLLADPQGPSNSAEIKKTESDVFIMGWLPRADLTEWGGPLQRVRFPWKKFGEDDEMMIWAFNDSGSTLTTGMALRVETMIAGHWMDD